MLPLVVIVGVSSALIFGAADFLGGLAAKRISALRVTAIAALTGLAVLIVVTPLLGGEWSTEAVLLGALSGVVGAIAIGLLYACLAIGPMSILSPLTAVVSALVPVTVGLGQGDDLGVLGFIAIGLALIAVVLVGFVREERAVRPSVRGLAMATGSGVMIGLFLVILEATPSDSGLVPLLANRATHATVMFAAVGMIAFVGWKRMRTRLSPPGTIPTGTGWKAGLWLAVVAGVFDITANIGVLLNLRLGELSVVAVLTALYPAGTIILAAIVIRERIAVVQYVGLVLAIAAAAMLALP